MDTFLGNIFDFEIWEDDRSLSLEMFQPILLVYLRQTEAHHPCKTAKKTY